MNNITIIPENLPYAFDYDNIVLTKTFQHVGDGFAFRISNDKKSIHIYNEDDGFFTYDKTIPKNEFDTACKKVLEIIKVKKRMKRKGDELDIVGFPYPFGCRCVGNFSKLKDIVLSYHKKCGD